MLNKYSRKARKIAPNCKEERAIPFWLTETQMIITPVPIFGLKARFFQAF